MSTLEQINSSASHILVPTKSTRIVPVVCQQRLVLNLTCGRSRIVLEVHHMQHVASAKHDVRAGLALRILCESHTTIQA